MSIKIILKKFVFFICVINLLSCENNRLVDLESQVNEVIEKNKSHRTVSLKMDTISSFKWDNLLVVGPYSLLDEISEKEDIDLGIIPNTIQDHDSFILIVFLHNNVGIKWFYMDRPINSKDLFQGGNGYGIYPKAQSNFILKN